MKAFDEAHSAFERGEQAHVSSFAGVEKI
jgi:hypothetical protein